MCYSAYHSQRSVKNTDLRWFNFPCGLSPGSLFYRRMYLLLFLSLSRLYLYCHETVLTFMVFSLYCLIDKHKFMLGTQMYFILLVFFLVQTREKEKRLALHLESLNMLVGAPSAKLPCLWVFRAPQSR